MSASFENKTKMVLNHLVNKGSITSWEAINNYRATRLSAIIFILKERGFDIVTEMKYDSESKTRWGVYHLSKGLTNNNQD